MAVDEAEFSELFASEYGRLCWLGLLLTGSRAQAEELAQEALARTWWRWKLVRRPDDPGSYARRVLVNRHRSLLRRAAVEARSLARSRPVEEVAPPAGDERAIVLWQAVQALPARQRAVLVLRFHQDLEAGRVAATRSPRPPAWRWSPCSAGPCWSLAASPRTVGPSRRPLRSCRSLPRGSSSPSPAAGGSRSS